MPVMPDDICWADPGEVQDAGMWGECAMAKGKIYNVCLDNYMDWDQEEFTNGVCTEYFARDYPNFLAKFIKMLKESRQGEDIIEGAAEAEGDGFDWTVASIALTTGFVAAYALCKIRKDKTVDDFHRA